MINGVIYSLVVTDVLIGLLCIDSSTETSSNYHESDQFSMLDEPVDRKKKSTRGRKNRALDGEHSSILNSNLNSRFLISDQNVSSRKTVNSQNTLQSYGNLEMELTSSRKPKIKRNPSLEASNDFDLRKPIQKVKEANHPVQSIKGDSKEAKQQLKKDMMQIEPPTFNTRVAEEIFSAPKVQPVERQDDSMDSDEVKIESRFAYKSAELKTKLARLEMQLASYTSPSNAGINIATTIHECLICLSVEALSTDELLEYLQHDMGKLLYVLVNLLDEFEKYTLRYSIAVHVSVAHLSCLSYSHSYPQIKQKKEKVTNLLNTLKMRIISNVK